MEYFKVYLPSNASQDLYPNNTPSNYRTRFDRPINLDGEWEVGVESIFYASNAGDTSREAQLYCNVEVPQAKSSNTQKYVLDHEGKWKGFNGIMPTKYEENPKSIKTVVETLQSMSSQILDNKEEVYTFSENSSHLIHLLESLPYT